MKKIIVSITLISLLYSCKKEEKTAEITSKNNETASIKINFNLPPVYLDSLKSEKEILNHLQQRKKEIIKLLENSSSPEENDLIYENYRKENDSALVLLEGKQAGLLEKFYEFYDYNPETEKSILKIPESEKETVRSYGQSGIEFWDIGEAITELRMFPDFYSKIFNGKLTPDYQRYLGFVSEENKVLFVSDASISIPWSDVAKRVLARESFLNDFPASKLDKKVQGELQEYRAAYLLGYDNTPTQNDGGGFTAENLKEFQRFLKENPKSETSAIIKTMLAMPKDRYEMYRFVNHKLGLPYEE
ncbi:hypothetical protein ACM39_07795 [Chryseobacterium sp. FH2]|uniref:hypothetical protein n=1 Tax=Chryseobacterium sp. FH2 TaxID=1674291 RepID=UPI00065ADF41|nr:hypothetical protein [Chryseobacterium sp. FH2]KMQ68410.1 hypothetical protein ACM39_07795 [Chryseobacterium sp. FH2]